MYRCEKCNEAFNAAHINWVNIVESEACPNPRCRAPLPDNLLPQFWCENCNKIKPSEKSAKINPLTKIAFKLIRTLPISHTSSSLNLRRVCTDCKSQTTFFGLFMLILFTWYTYQINFGSRADEITCNETMYTAEKTPYFKPPIKAVIKGINGAKEISFYSAPHTICKTTKVIINEKSYVAVYRSYNGWSNVMHRGHVGWVPDYQIKTIGEYETLKQ